MIITVDGQDQQIHRYFSDDSLEVTIRIDDRYYRVHPDGSDNAYFMIKVGGIQRSIRGPLDNLIPSLVRVHRVYRRYDDDIRRAKEAAQRNRDRRLNTIAEENQ